MEERSRLIKDDLKTKSCPKSEQIFLSSLLLHKTFVHSDGIWTSVHTQNASFASY